MKKILAIVLAVVMLLPVFAVNVFAADEPASADEIVVFENAEGFSDFDPKEPNAFFGKGRVWNRDDSDIFTLSMDEIKAIISEGGSTFSFVYTGSPVGWCNGGIPVVYFHAFDFPAACKVANTEDGKKVATLDLDEALKAWEANGKTVDDITDFTIQHGQNDFTLYSAKFTKKSDSGEAEEIVLVENKEFKSWEVLIEGTNADALKAAMSKEGAVFEASYTTNGNKGWGFQLIFETNSITEGLTADGNKNTKAITSETIVNQLGSVDNITLFRSNYGVKKVTYNSIKVVKGNEVLVELGERAPATWGEILTKEELAEVKKALSEEGTTIIFEYTTEGEGWGAQLITETAGKTIGLEKNAVDKTIKMTAAEFAAACGGDIKYLARLRNNCDGGAGDTVTYNYIKVTVPASGKKRVSSNLAFVYVTDEYHAVLIRGRFLAMPHTDIGGYCPMCHAVIESEATDQSVLVLETTGGQDYQDAPGTFADGVVLVDAENTGNARIATNWIDGGKAWNAVVKAIPTEGAWLKVTYTGKLNGVIFQTEKTSAPEAFETTAPAVVEEGEKNVAWFNCADIVANSPVALSGDIGGWANFMLNFEGDTTVYGFEVLVPAEAPVAE